jgi:hypothetical protein
MQDQRDVIWKHQKWEMVRGDQASAVLGGGTFGIISRGSFDWALSGRFRSVGCDHMVGA